MSNFQLSFKIPSQETKINHKEKILFLGSCFSDEIAAKANFSGFNVLSNPFGTVFHPIALARFIKETLSSSFQKERIFQREDLFFSLDANSTIYGLNESEVTNKLKDLRIEWLHQLKSASHLFITFGTAWGYTHIEGEVLVANCHKLSSQQFEKRLTSTQEIVQCWMAVIKELKAINPQLTVCFTVSPVRHSKDGLIENNQSKALLIDAIRQLKESSNVEYFPSYEIVMDELRDYRFFKLDRVHPNEEAIDYVWQRFEATYCSVETIELSRKVKHLKLALSHKSLHPESNETLEHKKRVEQLCNEFKAAYPFIILA